MKIMAKRSISIILSLVLCIGMVFGVNLSVYAANVDYVYSGNYIKNWGVRETVATFLSQNAIAFYEDNDTSYAELTELLGSSTEKNIPSSALYKELQNLMKSNHTYQTSYEATKNLFQHTDCENSGTTSSKISSFYSGDSIGPSWDGGSTWNREHTWPNSKGDMSGNGENDIMMLRPTSSSENSSRGNKAYGKSSGYYNPNNESGGKYDLRGDVARIILYQYVRWGCTNTGSYNPNGIFGTDGVFESKELLLDWVEADPVDTWELGRNDSVESITGTRNVFVDYPELAFDLFDEQIPENYITPSGYYTDGDVTDNNGNGSTGDDNTDTPVETGPAVVDAPVAGTAYKFGMVQGNKNNTTYYLVGGMDGYYMASTDNFDSGIDVYLEQTSGGYYLYTKVDGAKTYINMVVSGTHVNGAYESTASTVYTYDSTSKTIIATVNDVTYWFGTRNDKTYTTIGPCATSYNGFYCQFYSSDDEQTENPGTPDTPVVPEDPSDPEVPSVSGGEVVLTVDSLGLASNSYSASTATVDGVGFEWVQLGNYGNGIQVRDNSEKGTSFFWNTTAFGAPIKEIKLVYSSTKDVTYSNENAEIFSFGNAVDSYTYSTKLSTTAGVKEYTITPDAETYTFLKFEHDVGYTFYWDSITIVLAGGSAGGDTPDLPTDECNHIGCYMQSNGDGTHTAVCDNCGKRLDYTENCYDTIVVDGRCDDCSAPVVTITPPVAGAKYKFGMIQGNVSDTDVYYIDGAMNGYYMNTTLDFSNAIDVCVEATTGGYYLYTNIDGVKTYINMVVSGTHVNGAYEATASTIYTFDTTKGTLIADVDGTAYWFGTRNDKEYTTVGPCATSYNGFYCTFYPSSSSEQNEDGSWTITVGETASYTITPNEAFEGEFSIYDIAVLDKNNSLVKLNEEKGSYPLVAHQEYIVRFVGDYSDNINGTLEWNMTKVTSKLFADVPAGEWYNDAVTYSVGAGIITGYGGTNNFGTADKISRHDFVVILARFAGVDLSVYDDAEISFKDVPDNQYYTNAILWAAESGITSGYTSGVNAGKFGVGDEVTREQLVTFLYRYAKNINGSTPEVSDDAAQKAAAYPDFAAVGSYATEAVIWALDKGVISGQGGTHIAPGGNALRAEVAKIFYNIYLNNTL